MQDFNPHNTLWGIIITSAFCFQWGNWAWGSLGRFFPGSQNQKVVGQDPNSGPEPLTLQRVQTRVLCFRGTRTHSSGWGLCFRGGVQLEGPCRILALKDERSRAGNKPSEGIPGKKTEETPHVWENASFPRWRNWCACLLCHSEVDASNMALGPKR